MTAPDRPPAPRRPGPGRRLLLAVLLAPALGAASGRAAEGDDLAALLEGVEAIAAPGVPGPLVVFGPEAFPVVAAPARPGLQEPVVAAARWGRGRVVAFGHGGYLGRQAQDVADTARLLANAVRWTGARAADRAPRVALLGTARLAEILPGLRVEILDGGAWARGLDRVDVLVADATRFGRAPDREAVSSFVRAGGGLVTAGLGWGWRQLNPGRDLATEHPGNLLLAPAGIVWADGTLRRTAEEGYAADASPPPLAHARRALEALAARAEASPPAASPPDLAQAEGVLTHAVRSLPPDDEHLLPGLRARLGGAERRWPTPQRPLGAGDGLARVLLAWEVERIPWDEPERIAAHPAAEAFPGAVPPGAPRVRRTVDVDPSRPDWHGTGLYAPPGEVVTVRIPAAATGRGLGVRIGCHRDEIWHHAAWKRVPRITHRWPLAAEVTRVASPFGGPVYVVAPRAGAPGRVEVQIEGAVQAPRFVLGRTSPRAWREEVRGLPGPWAELETEKVALTVPSDAIRDLEDPEPVLRFWDEVLDACAHLAARPLERARPERYVTDVQISAGYMHAGHPIMTHLDAAARMVSLRAMRGRDGKVPWGLFHEMGHNHQSGDWTFAGAGEVTVNLFSLYVSETLCGVEEGAHGALEGDRPRRRLERHVAEGAPFEAWKREPFLALWMYVQMKRTFGWDAFRRVFAEYRALAPGERPRTDDAKRDQWLVRFSRTVGRDLGPFFEAWGVPTSEAARASLKDLPPWMPEDFPEAGRR